MIDSNPGYILKVKNGAGWRRFDIARLQISVGQPYHEGAKLVATIDWVRSRFKHVIVCVNDTLQRYNLRLEQGLPDQIAATVTRKAGDDWLTRNGDFFKILPSYKIYRWDDWREQPNFAQKLAEIQCLYDTHADMRDLIAKDIALFWSRRAMRLGVDENFRRATYEKLSTAYLLEETAAFFMMFEQHRAADIYPGSALLPCVLNQLYGPDAGRAEDAGISAFTRIDFLRRNSSRKKA